MKRHRVKSDLHFPIFHIRAESTFWVVQCGSCRFRLQLGVTSRWCLRGLPSNTALFQQSVPI